MKNLIVGAVIFGFLASFGGGFYTGQIYGYVPPVRGAANLDAGQPQDADFSLFWDAWRIVQEEYAGPAPLDFKAMVQGAIKGMVNSLGDPYTSYMTAEDTKVFLEDVSGSFGGVGMEIGIRDEKLRVVAPLDGTPAARAGLRAGDHIIRIGEDTFTADLSIDEAVAKIRGPEGTTVALSIAREGWDEPRDFVIKREVINIPSLQWEVKENGVVYVKLFQFSDNLRGDFRNLERDVLRSTDKIVLDLRNNPGGFLHVAVDIAGWFVQNGDVVVIEDFGSNEDQLVHKARGNAKLANYKVVVLINEGSASASEILAGALRDDRGTLLIGQKSFGKGSVQEVKELKDESSLKVTVAKWFTPGGNLIADKGLEPDISVEITDEDLDAGKDPQLDKAIETLLKL